MKNFLALIPLTILSLLIRAQSDSAPFVFTVKGADTLNLVASVEEPELDRMVFAGGGSWWPANDEEPTLISTTKVYPSIDLSGQGLRTIPFDYCVESWAGKYDLSDNKINKLTKRFGKVSTDSLDLRSNRISVLKPGCLYHRLVYLNLSQNALEVLPFGVDFGSRLRHLDLGYNGLTYLPNSFYAPQLRVLNLEGNALDRLPSRMKSLTRLRQLDLSDNEFTSMPSSIPCLTNLEYLDLSNNGLQIVPYKIRKLRYLRTLDLRGNPLKDGVEEKLRKLLPQCEILV